MMQIHQTIKTIGRVNYDPHRGDMKNRTKGWCVVDVDREITRYYRWWVKRMLHVNLELPSWDAHVSLIRGETIRPEKQHLWRKYQGQPIEIHYTPIVRQSGDTTQGDRPDFFWFVDVYSEDIRAIRNELGLFAYPHYHLTVGRTYY